MKRALLLPFLTLALAACSQTVAPPPLTDLDLNAGRAATLRLDVPGASGSWRIEGAPSWIVPEDRTGVGQIHTILRLERPPLGDDPTVAGDFTVRVTNDTGERTFRVAVKADMFRLSGRLGNGASASGADAAATAAKPARRSREATGLIVKYRDETGLARAQSLGARTGGLARGGGRTALLRGATDANLASLAADPSVEYAVPDSVLHAHGQTARLPADQYAPLQWPFQLAGYGAVWRDMEVSNAYTRPVTVAVLDTGVRFDHPDLQGALWGPGEGALDLVAPPTREGGLGDDQGLDEDPTDPPAPNKDGSHGTHVTGLIAARWGKFTAPCPSCSDSGVAGAAYRAPIKVLPVRVLDANGDGSLFTIAQGLRYAAGETITATIGGVERQLTNPHPAQVVNMSLGGSISESAARPLCEAVAAVVARGVLVVASGGNDGSDALNFPAACEGAVAVASVSLAEGRPERAYYSNTYAQIALAAPGGDTSGHFNGGVLNDASFPDAVFSTSWNYADDRPSYEGMIGTSQAAPQVTALAALLFSKGVVNTAQEALARLESTATDLGEPGRDVQTGFGLVNAARALNAPAVDPAKRVIAQRRLSDGRVQNVTLPLDETGRFDTFLRDGAYAALVMDALSDTNPVGSSATPSATFELGESSPSRDLGVLTPR